MKSNNKYNKFVIQKDLYCINCDTYGHIFKNCYDAITSCGVILLSLDIDQDIKDIIINKLEYSNNELVNIFNKNHDDIGITINDSVDIELFCKLKDKIKFLLIRRKHTLGFLEFIRGRYNLENIDGIIFLFKQMTIEEINKIKTLPFDKLWDEVWGDNKRKISYQHEYTISMDKFNKLKTENDEFLSLKFYTENVNPLWNCAEWGFPKGRRNFKESNKDCAIREFKEETGYDDNEFMTFSNIDQIDENFIGTNGVNYKHIYFLGFSTNNKIPMIDINNFTQASEIGDIGYFSYEEAIKKIRPYHIDRQKIITHVYIYIINYLIKHIKELLNKK